MKLLSLRGHAIHVMTPASFGIAYVLLSFAEFPTPTGDLLRPILVVLAASVLLTTMLRVILGSWSSASVVASIGFVLASAPWILVAVVVAALAWAGLLAFRGRLRRGSLRKPDWGRVAQAVAVFGSAFLLIAAMLTAPSAIGGTYLRLGEPAETGPATLPNVYLFLLDGYPRNSTLVEVYDFDNGPFEAELGELGFSVAAGSRSNYPHTWLTFASMLNGEYLDGMESLEPPPEAAEEQYRALMTAVNDGAMFDRLREQGYSITVVPSPFRGVAPQAVDRYLDTGQLSAFEYSLLLHSSLGRAITTFAPSYLMDQQRDRFHAALAGVVGVAREPQRPSFVFAHLLSPPHAPLVYDRHGNPLPLPECVPSTCALWEFPDEESWDRLPEQIAYTNSQLVTALREIVIADPDAVIILMSDHGSRRDAGRLDEFFHSFFAVRDAGRLGLGEDVSPVNVLRAIVSDGPGRDAPPLPYRAWMFADELRPLELRTYSPAP
jgi:hypothetical protein